MPPETCRWAASCASQPSPPCCSPSTAFPDRSWPLSVVRCSIAECWQAPQAQLGKDDSWLMVVWSWHLWHVWHFWHDTFCQPSFLSIGQTTVPQLHQVGWEINLLLSDFGDHLPWVWAMQRIRRMAILAYYQEMTDENISEHIPSHCFSRSRSCGGWCHSYRKRKSRKARVTFPSSFIWCSSLILCNAIDHTDYFVECGCYWRIENSQFEIKFHLGLQLEKDVQKDRDCLWLPRHWRINILERSKRSVGGLVGAMGGAMDPPKS